MGVVFGGRVTIITLLQVFLKRMYLPCSLLHILNNLLLTIIN